MNFDEFKARYLKRINGAFEISDEELAKIFCGFLVHSEWEKENHEKALKRNTKRRVKPNGKKET